MFSFHNTALLDKLTGPEWSHDSVTAIRIPTAPGNWELRLRDGQSTWDTLPQRILSLKVCMTTNHAQRLRKQRTHRKKPREGTSAAHLLGSLLVPSPDDLQLHAWPWGPEGPSVLPLIGLSPSLFLLKLVALCYLQPKEA